MAEIRRQIAAGMWKPGSKLPTERDLSTTFGVSRSVIREAVSMLVAFGILRARQGGGVFVCETLDESVFESLAFVLPASPRTLQELMDVRKVLEVRAAELAATSATAEDLEVLRIAVEGIRRAPTVAEKIRTGMNFHNAVACASHNHLLTRLLHSLMDLFVASHRVTLQSAEARATAVEDHEAIYRAIERRVARAAGRAMKAHLDLTQRQLDALLTVTPPLRGRRGANHYEE